MKIATAVIDLFFIYVHTIDSAHVCDKLFGPCVCVCCIPLKPLGEAEILEIFTITTTTSTATATAATTPTTATYKKGLLPYARVLWVSTVT